MIICENSVLVNSLLKTYDFHATRMVQKCVIIDILNDKMKNYFISRKQNIFLYKRYYFYKLSKKFAHKI